ncbi:CCA tRNA nucleotidyltransferase [Fretibacter rubidus]|uniref:CCA tRNA nucleotidyltransferase n=1 Tax=Fretibacter rubidus TaxID=570162 RepID=UPI00352B68AD
MTDLNPQQYAWMREPAVSQLFKAFPKGQLRFVGGCVRNALMGEAVADVDLATPLTPDAVIKVLDAASIRHIPTGIDHGTVTVIIDGKPYEVTSLRKDVETDGRRAVVAFTTDWTEDAYRRDLTMNALYADFDGTVYDPCGQGVDDLKARRFRFVGDADARVREDYLRILRFFRFIAWYGSTHKDGQGVIDADALRACRENAKGLKTLSAERIWSETKKLLSAPDPCRAVRIMLTNDILDTLLPEASNSVGLDAIVALERREAIKPDPLLRLMAMGAREPLAIVLLTKRLKMSNSESTRLRAWADDATALDPNADDRTKRIAIYTAGKQVIIDRARIRAAGSDDPIKSSRWMSLADLAMGWTRPTFPLTGKDLIKAGVEPGEAMGKKMAALKALWVRSGFSVDKDKLLMALKLLG